MKKGELKNKRAEMSFLVKMLLFALAFIVMMLAVFYLKNFFKSLI
jgi:cell division protein FtsL